MYMCVRGIDFVSFYKWAVMNMCVRGIYFASFYKWAVMYTYTWPLTFIKRQTSILLTLTHI
jgi:hypothetical protein